MKRTKSILPILFGVYLIFAMGGLSIFHHLCNCSIEEETTSVFSNQSCCSSSMPEPATCHNDTQQNAYDDDCESGNCTTEIELLTLNETLTVESNTLSSPNQPLIAIPSITQAVNYSSLNSKSTIYNKDLPPPKTGRSIVILHQCLKVPFRA
ncbi:MAG: hypothetical protein WC951_07325 [Bacteroidales bacterium]